MEEIAIILTATLEHHFFQFNNKINKQEVGWPMAAIVLYLRTEIYIQNTIINIVNVEESLDTADKSFEEINLIKPKLHIEVKNEITG
jgi:hypothetical protein